jgi:2-polyprenyl-6-methoxyphenol hydroxylase-like FAD-dependent oxidoreductase
MEILISGASVAGPTLAYWLNRNGHRVTVVERAPALREGGYKVDIRGAAIDVIEKMGLLDQVHAAGTDMRVARFVDGTSKQLATMDAEIFGGRSTGDIEIMRGDLAKLLYDATAADVEYVFGDSITSLTEDADGVRVTFENASARTFDLVIGADGLHSNVRALAFGPEDQFVHHLGHYISIFSVPNHRDLDREEMMHGAPGRTAGMYATRQMTDAKALFMFAAPELEYDRRDLKQQQDLLADAYAGLRWDVPRLLTEMRTAPDFYFDAISQVRMDRWTTRRIALVGDAACCPSPASGQGTSVSLVGAYVLAGELGEDGFGDYEAIVRPYAEANQKLAASNLKGMVVKSKFQLRFQMFMLRLMPRLPGRDAMVRRITDAIHSAATAIELKNY